MVPNQHGATAWKHWIFCLTDHLDFENLENRRRYHNPGKPRTAGLCGREVVASDHLPLSSTFFGWPKPPDLTHKTAALVPLPKLFSSLEIPSQSFLVNLRTHRPHTARSFRSVPGYRPLRQSLTQPLTGGNDWWIRFVLRRLRIPSPGQRDRPTVSGAWQLKRHVPWWRRIRL